MQPSKLKIAFSGSSGSGKTTLLGHVAKTFNLKHISGSAGDVKQEGDKMIVDDVYHYPGGGHVGVIRYSALNPEYGLINQKLLQMRRQELILNNHRFVTDRSPADNLTYFINQVAYHPMITDQVCEAFMADCLKAWQELDAVIYIRAVQPIEVERNGSRVANRFYQKSIDAQFEYWINNFFIPNANPGPEVLIIDFWDWEQRVTVVEEFIGRIIK